MKYLLYCRYAYYVKIMYQSQDNANFIKKNKRVEA